jgi:acetyl-CoA C-acetyltransferase
MPGIFVTAAELNGRFTGRPEAPLHEMMITAAQRALEAAGLAPGAVAGLYAGAMGNFTPEGFVGPIPIRLANTLKLRNADITPMLVGSSEAGAWALRLAYDTMRRSPSYRHVLVVAGEQMNPLAAERTVAEPLAVRQARNRAISEILDELERSYGLNMLRAGDLLVDAMRATDGWTARDLSDGLLPLLAVSKYTRVQDYPCGQLCGRVTASVAAYRSRAPLSTWFGLDDVTPTSSGAVALVLSREPRPESLEILGMGQSVVPLSLAARQGDPRQARAVRRAIARACRDADVDLEWLRACEFALVHDAFPSIEYFFLKELGFTAAEIVGLVGTGWSNPFGGLKACGHALGASGLLQVAKAHHRIFKSKRYLTAEARARLPEVSRCFATSVGGPLTNVVVSILQRYEGDTDHAPTGRLVDEYERDTGRSDRRWEQVRREIPPGQGLLLAATHIVHDAAFGDDEVPLLAARGAPWVLWCEGSPGPQEAPPKTFAWAEERPADGELVRLVPEAVGGVEYLRAEPTGRRLELPVLRRPAVDDALRADLRERLAAYEPQERQLPPTTAGAP